MPEDRPVEQRDQTQHKLETMARYWRTWCWIVAHANPHWFCQNHMWLVDTMAGTGLQRSAGAPGGRIPGTPLQAVLAARATQQAVPAAVVHVRAIDIDSSLIRQLDKLIEPRCGAAPDKVDALASAEDWVKAVPRIAQEITSTADHPHPGGRFGSHEHRSLWLVDPFGIGPLDYTVIRDLPRHAEVVVNFDANSARRFGPRELGLLGRVFRDDRWRSCRTDDDFARAFMEQFDGFEHRNMYRLQTTGSQHRFLIHLTHSDAAVRPFRSSVASAQKAGTLWAEGLMTTQQKQAAVIALFEMFRGLALSVDEMYEAGAGYSKQQLRAIIQVAVDMNFAVVEGKIVIWSDEAPPDEMTFGL